MKAETAAAEDIPDRRTLIEPGGENKAHGTVLLKTEHLTLRRYHADDAEQLYREFGTDPEMYRYSGWNPYADLAMAEQCVARFISSYDEDHAWSWIMDYNGMIAGTIGAYDYREGQAEAGFSVAKRWQGRGFATEALKEVLRYLTQNEGISCVTAWCASENTGSRRVLEKSGMRLVRTEKDGLCVEDRIYDRLIFEYRKQDPNQEER